MTPRDLADRLETREALDLIKKLARYDIPGDDGHSYSEETTERESNDLHLMVTKARLLLYNARTPSGEPRGVGRGELAIKFEAMLKTYTPGIKFFEFFHENQGAILTALRCALPTADRDAIREALKEAAKYVAIYDGMSLNDEPLHALGKITAALALIGEG